MDQADREAKGEEQSEQQQRRGKRRRNALQIVQVQDMGAPLKASVWMHMANKQAFVHFVKALHLVASEATFKWHVAEQPGGFSGLSVHAMTPCKTLAIVVHMHGEVHVTRENRCTSFHVHVPTLMKMITEVVPGSNTLQMYLTSAVDRLFLKPWNPGSSGTLSVLDMCLLDPPRHAEHFSIPDKNYSFRINMDVSELRRIVLAGSAVGSSGLRLSIYTQREERGENLVVTCYLLFVQRGELGGLEQWFMSKTVQRVEAKGAPDVPGDDEKRDDTPYTISVQNEPGAAIMQLPPFHAVEETLPTIMFSNERLSQVLKCVHNNTHVTLLLAKTQPLVLETTFGSATSATDISKMTFVIPLIGSGDNSEPRPYHHMWFS